MILIFTMILAEQVFANNSCFDSQAVKDLIQASEDLNDCFSNDVNNCPFHKLTIAQEREVNSERLVPFDRTSSELMNNATGAVSAHFSEGTDAASGQKISSCHIITSAHLLYTETEVRVDDKDLPALKDSVDFNVNFHTGQTCDDERRFDKKVGAQVFFKMTKKKTDFVCKIEDKKGNCLQRAFYGKTDLVILKLKKYDKDDNVFFKLKTTQIATSSTGDRVNCWGYPVYNDLIKLPESMSNKMLWLQKDAKIFAGEHERGVLTNATAYPGMSGGGCATSANPNELVGVLANKNNHSGRAVIDVTYETAHERPANFFSSFQYLAERYKQATGKDIADLDSECN